MEENKVTVIAKSNMGYCPQEIKQMNNKQLTYHNSSAVTTKWILSKCIS